MPSRIFVFVAKSRAAPGLDKVAEDEARGRHIAIAWFEIVSVSGDFTRARPIEGGPGQLNFKAATLGEILPSAGYFQTMGVNDTARDIT